MFRRANSAESFTGVPSNSPTSPPSSEAVNAWIANNNNNNNNHNHNDLNNHICPLCSRVFNSIQALGGHQNAHRKKRIEERAQYIRQRLKNYRIISGSNDNHVGVTVSMLSPHAPPSELYYYSRFEERSNDVKVGPSRKKTRIMNGSDDDDDKKEEGEGETLSLELTLAVRGSAKANGGSGPMAYTYLDVLFPASEFKETKLDLNLKL